MSQHSLSQKLEELVSQTTAHGSGAKKVFRTNEQMLNACTQIAHGVFLPGESCESHIHPTMVEYFFFIKGEGTYIIEEETVELEPNMFLEIPAGMRHSLHADKQKKLEFVYWGVAVDE